MFLHRQFLLLPGLPAVAGGDVERGFKRCAELASLHGVERQQNRNVQAYAMEPRLDARGGHGPHLLSGAPALRPKTRHHRQLHGTRVHGARASLPGRTDILLLTSHLHLILCILT